MSQHEPRRPLAAAPFVVVATLAVALFGAGCSRDHTVLSPQVEGRVTWNNTIFGLMRDRSTASATVGCMGCHFENNTQGIPDFTEYAEVVADTSNIKVRIQPFGGMDGYLHPGEADVITAWIHDGAPN